MDKHLLLSWPLLCTLAGEPVPMPDDLAEHLRIVSLTKGQTLFDAGQPHPYLYVVRQGCLKLIYRTLKGDEWVQDLVAEGTFFCSLTALHSQGLTSFACEALEACELECIDYVWMEEISTRHPLWQRALLRGWQDFAARKELRERDLLTLSPAQRYQAFVEANPGLAQRVPQKDLARFLGITPVSLSRIRGRLVSAHK
jgi:CRP-like cAMP-binding protein